MPSFARDNLTLSFDDLGPRSCPVLLLIHGHPFDRSMWAPQIQAAQAKGWRALAPDLRGYGQSGITPGKVAFKTFADDLAALLRHVDVTQAVIAGLSMGGQIVMELFHHAPELFRATVLADTSPAPETPEGRRQRTAMAHRLETEGMSGYAHEVLPRMISPRTIARDPKVADHVLQMMLSTSPQGAAAALRGRAERRDYRDLIRTIEVPSLIMVGREDSFISQADAEAVHRSLPASEFAIIDDAGHLPNLEQPQRFNTAFFDFIDRVR
ncbi:MAG TPA: alpha/beta fold hydrolase [Opitutaceae bacterium]|nr:alpha/beta fold hydrolase [Opitutaceae bacterium]